MTMFDGNTICDLIESVRLAEYRAVGEVFDYPFPDAEIPPQRLDSSSTGTFAPLDDESSFLDFYGAA